jgi:hypothetical protein
MKGIGILAVLFVGAVASLGVGGLLTAATLHRVENMMFSVQDIYVISEINRFENVKIGLPVAASYSFYQALYDVSMNFSLSITYFPKDGKSFSDK